MGHGAASSALSLPLRPGPSTAAPPLPFPGRPVPSDEVEGLGWLETGERNQAGVPQHLGLALLPRRPHGGGRSFPNSLR